MFKHDLLNIWRDHGGKVRPIAPYGDEKPRSATCFYLPDEI